MKFLGTHVGRPNHRPVSAWLEHGPFAMWLVGRLQPKRIVELGTHHGYSYFAMCQAVRESGLDTQCVAVDTWQGDEHAGFYGDRVYNEVAAENARFGLFSRLLRKTFRDALADVEDGSVDLLHVDGRHLYEDVREDFESWRPKLAPFSVILFHDTEVYERDFGVHRYWAEISAGTPSLNFRHGHGLGVLFRGEGAAQRFSEVFGGLGSDPHSGIVRDYFSAAGAAVAERAASDARLAQMQAQLAERDRTVADLEMKLAEARQRKSSWWRR